MSEQSADEFEERVKKQAYFRWVREGRRWLTKKEQDRMFFEEADNLHSQKAPPWWFRVRWLYVFYCAVAFFLLMGLLCLSAGTADKEIVRKWVRILWSSVFILLSFEILLTTKVCSIFRALLPEWLSSPRHLPMIVASSPWIARAFLLLTWSLTVVLMLGVYQLGQAEEISIGSPAPKEPVAAAPNPALTGELSDNAVDANDTALFYSILAGFFVFSALLMFASVFTKVKLEHERQQKSLTEGKRLLWEFCHLGLLELGIAIFIAFFITGTFELVLHRRTEQTNKRYMKKREDQQRKHLEEIETAEQKYREGTQRNLFSTLFGFNVNPRLGDEIFQTLRDASRFHREDCSLAFECDTLSDAEREQYLRGNKNADELIAVNVTVAYRIRNTAASAQQWKAEPFFVNSLQLGSVADRFLFFQVGDCDETENCVKAGAICDEDLRTKFACNGCRRQLSLGYVSVSPKKPTQFHYTYRMVKRSSDSHSWITVLPMDGLRISARSVDPRLELDFEVEAAHREEATPFGDRRAKLRKWRIEDPFLPNQGIILYWHPLNGKLKLAEPAKKPVAAPAPEKKPTG